MARPRKQVSNGRPLRQNDLASLSTKVLRLQALNLPITEGKATLISRLKLATGTKQPRSTSNSQAGCARTKRLAPKSRPVRATLTAAPAESSTKQANLENPGDGSSSVASGCNLDEIMGDFSFDDSPDPVQARTFHRRSTGCHTGHRQVLVRSSVAIISLVFRARPTAWHFQHATSQARISLSCGSQPSTEAEFTR